MNKSKLTLTAALAATALVGQTVSADEVVTAPVTETVETTTVVPVAAPVAAATEISAQDVATAQAEAEKAQADVTAQTAVVKEATTDVATAESNLTTAIADVAKAEELVANATPEGIANAEATITTAEEKVAEAKASVEPAADAVTNAEAAKTAQGGVVANAETVVANDQAAVNQADANVKSAQALLDGSEEAKLVKAADAAQANLTTARNGVATAEQNLEAAKVFDQNLSANIATAKTAVAEKTTVKDAAQANLTTANQAVSAAQATVNQETTDVANAKAAVANLESALGAVNSIAFPAGYVETITALANAKRGTTEYNNLLAQMEKYQAISIPANTYKSNAADKTRKVSDLNNLTLAERTELTLFTADLINQLRSVANPDLPKVVVNEDAIAIANEVATESLDVEFNHDYGALKTVATKYAIPAIVEDLDFMTGYSEQAFKNYGASYGTTDPDVFIKRVANNDPYHAGAIMTALTMDKLKEFVYVSLTKMLYLDSHAQWGHAKSILGLTTSVRNPNISKEYIGVDFADYKLNNPSSFATNTYKYHINLVDDVMATNSVNFDETANIASNSSTEDLTLNLTAARTALVAEQSQLLAATQTLNQAKAAQAEKSAALEDATNALNSAKATLASLEATPAKTASAEQALSAARTALTNAQKAHAQAQANLAALSANMKTKQANLAKAQADLTDKVSILAASQATLATEKAKLADLVTALDEAKAALATTQANVTKTESVLAEAKQYLSDLQAAPEKLAEAQAKQVSAQTKLEDAKSKLEKEEATLKSLETLLAALNLKYYQLQTDYTAQEAKKAEEKRQADIAAQKQAIIDAGGVATPILDDQGKVTGYVDGSKKVADVKSVLASQSSPKPTYSRVAREESLPKTGSKDSLALVVLGGLMAGVGLTFKRTRKEF